MQTLRMVCIVSLISILCSISARAACSGSGTTWSCPAGSSATDVQNAISSASDGATITFAAGTYSWSTWIQFSMSKGVTLQCATAPLSNGAATSNACTINAGSSTVLGMYPFTGTSTKLYRITGFQFTNSNTSGGAIWFATGSGHGTLTQFRMDHNTFTMAAQAMAFSIGSTGDYTYVYGVIDHNTVNAAGAGNLYMWWGAEDPTPPPSPLGTANNLFLEDNIFNNAHLAGYESTPCFSDTWGSTASVIRHNTIYNCLVGVHGIDHAGGPQNWEVYNNQLIYNSGANGTSYPDGYRMIHHQGSGEEIYFNNTFAPLTEPHSGQMLSFTANYVDSVCSGAYPCSHQPGRDFANYTVSGTGGSNSNLMSIYIWNNLDTNNNSQVLGANESAGTWVQNNRDYYNAVSTSAQTSPTSPFNGTTGMGFGTLGNRPTVCTTTGSTRPADAGHGGVGYAVQTVTGTIGASASGVASDAVLYTCTAANTWTAYYTPYTYPHPLVSGTTSGGGKAPNAPAGLQATVQ